MPEAFGVDEYVRTGRGDARKALNALYYWAWNTEEVVELIEWMRRINADPARAKKVRFYGFDIQSSMRAARVTADYLRRVDPLLQALTLMETHANPFTTGDFAALSPGPRQEALVAA